MHTKQWQQGTESGWKSTASFETVTTPGSLDPNPVSLLMCLCAKSTCYEVRECSSDVLDLMLYGDTIIRVTVYKEPGKRPKFLNIKKC